MSSLHPPRIGPLFHSLSISTLTSITDEIMYAIMELSGQEYVDMYAPSAKEAAAREAKAQEADEVSPQA